MKLKSLLFVICFSLFNSVFAANVHLNPKASPADKKNLTQAMVYPGYCEIEIINNSFDDVYVYGTFDDGVPIDFSIYRDDRPHYVNLFYYSYCHSGMYLTIQTRYGVIYSGWTNVDSTVHIVPYINTLKAEISHR